MTRSEIVLVTDVDPEQDLVGLMTRLRPRGGAVINTLLTAPEDVQVPELRRLASETGGVVHSIFDDFLTGKLRSDRGF